MYYTTNKRRSHRSGFNQPIIENIFSDFINTPINNIITKKDNPYNQPSTNIIEEDDKFILEIATPGIKKETLNISVDKQTLIISKVEENDDTDKKTDEINYKKREFNYASFEKKFTIPNNILLDKIVAELNNGILQITLSKNPAFKKTINIK